MHSPSSPLSPISSSMRGRLTRQVKRALPVYIACILFIFFLSYGGSLGSAVSSSGSVLKRSITHQKPLSSTAKFPRKIWQTWKIGPLGFDERDLLTARTWMQKNPGHRYEVLTDDNDLQYVEHHYGPAGLNRPDIVELYRDLKVTIVKADLLRYLVMYAEGGVYADIDVEALKPFQRWIPERFNEADINMIIGIEIDQPDFNTHSILGKKSQSFCQWTFACKPHLPVMMRLIEQIQRWLHSVAKEQNVPLGEIHLDFDEVISGTGPSAFTSAILKDMTARNGGREVSWPTFHALDESKLVGGVLVLTVEAFAAGQGHSDSGNHNARGALVKHHYHASQWPKNHPRFNHPMFGEVEKCNWVTECVSKWDADVAAFALLPPDEQAKQIEIKKAAEATLPGLSQPPVLDFPPAPQAMHNMDPVAQQQGQFPNPPPPGQLPPPMQALNQGPPPAAALPGLPFPEAPKELPQEQPPLELH